MTNLNLPKGYLSHTQMDSWTKSKKEYRKRYYEGCPMYITPELEFGKKIANQYEALHTDPQTDVEHPIIRNLPRGDVAEYELRCSIRDIPVLGFIDSYETDTNHIRELKTGKTPWTQARVDRHPQLKMYCACIKAIVGEYNPYVDLLWVQTENVEDMTEIDGMKFGTRKIQLTGEYDRFTTIITANQLLEYEQLVERVAREISEDFTLWTRLHHQT